MKIYNVSIWLITQLCEVKKIYPIRSVSVILIIRRAITHNEEISGNGSIYKFNKRCVTSLFIQRLHQQLDSSSVVKLLLDNFFRFEMN